MAIFKCLPCNSKGAPCSRVRTRLLLSCGEIQRRTEETWPPSTEGSKRPATRDKQLPSGLNRSIQNRKIHERKISADDNALFETRLIQKGQQGLLAEESDMRILPGRS